MAEVVVPDNLKSAVTHPSYYEPDLNPTYRDVGEHYGMAIIPARPYRPRDKAYVSYCTLSGARNVETRLLRLPASLAFENSILVQRFI